MPGPQHSRMTRTELDRLVISYASSSYPFEIREKAVQAVLSFNDLQTTKLDENGFDAAVVALAAKLGVTMPTVPADLTTLDDAQIVALADAMELAQWDFQRRAHALNYTQTFWQQRAPTVPTSLQYRDMFLRIANYMRAVRGLSAVT